MNTLEKLDQQRNINKNLIIEKNLKSINYCDSVECSESDQYQNHLQHIQMGLIGNKNMNKFNIVSQQMESKIIGNSKIVSRYYDKNSVSSQFSGFQDKTDLEFSFQNQENFVQKVKGNIFDPSNLKYIDSNNEQSVNFGNNNNSTTISGYTDKTNFKFITDLKV